jgi:hypothetical protein
MKQIYIQIPGIKDCKSEVAHADSQPKVSPDCTPVTNLGSWVGHCRTALRALQIRERQPLRHSLRPFNRSQQLPFPHQISLPTSSQLSDVA